MQYNWTIKASDFFFFTDKDQNLAIWGLMSNNLHVPVYFLAQLVHSAAKPYVEPDSTPWQ